MEVVEAKREAVEPFLNRELGGVNQEQFGRADPEIWRAQEYALAAYEGGEMVGALVFKIEAGVGKLSQLLVAQGHRDKGVGGRLLSRFEELCQKEGCHKVRLITYADSRAEGFFRLHGYIREGLLRRDLQGVDMSQMAKFLLEEGG
jgi:GNAT superfamily N-acetyltransferase